MNLYKPGGAQWQKKNEISLIFKWFGGY